MSVAVVIVVISFNNYVLRVFIFANEIIIICDRTANSKMAPDLISNTKNFVANNNNINIHVKHQVNKIESDLNSNLTQNGVPDKNESDNVSAAIDANAEDHFIKCIFFCKFHAVAGPQIAAQVPNNYIPKDTFDTISQYVIPKAQLQRSFVSV